MKSSASDITVDNDVSPLILKEVSVESAVLKLVVLTVPPLDTLLIAVERDKSLLFLVEISVDKPLLKLVSPLLLRDSSVEIKVLKLKSLEVLSDISAEIVNTFPLSEIPTPVAV